MDIRIKEEKSKDFIENLMMIRKGLKYYQSSQKLNTNLKDIKLAKKIILEAIKNKENILIFGDYDVDGITSTAILYDYLKSIKANVNYLLPTRDDGYGLNTKSVKKIIKLNPDLLITVDNGITALEEIDRLKENGINVVITDHHEPIVENGLQLIPDADAAINPKQHDCEGSKNLSGCAVVYCLVNEIAEKEKIEYLPLVALSTISDMMHLDLVNKTLVQKGLQYINKKHKSLISEIIRKLVKKRIVDEQELAFRLAPLINSAGRIDNPNLSLECILNNTNLDKLIKINNTRKELQEEEYYNADSLKTILDNKVLISECETPGIAGIIAGKLKDKYGLPTIVFGTENKASCRGIEDLNFLEVLQKIKGIKAAGHNAAFGLDIKELDINEFLTRLENAIKDINIPKYVKEVDAMLDIRHINLNNAKEIEKLKPFGKGNEEPEFYSELVIRKTTQYEKCLQVEFFNGLRGVYFGKLEEDLNYQDLVGIIYKLQVNEYRGKEQLQLVISSIEKYRE